MKGTSALRPKQFFVRISPRIAGGGAVVTEMCNMAIAAHALSAVQVTTKLATNDGQFTHEAETGFRPCLPSHCSGVCEICHMALPGQALAAVEVRLKLVSN
jgi:hypothetical protein